MITFNMRKHQKELGLHEVGLFQNGLDSIVMLFSIEDPTNEKELVLMDSMGKLYEPNEWVAWIPLLDVMSSLNKKENINHIETLQDVLSDGKEHHILFFNPENMEPDDETDIAGLLEIKMSNDRILFAPSLITVLEELYREEIIEMQDNGTFQKEITNLVSELISENFPFWTELKPIEAQ